VTLTFYHFCRITTYLLTMYKFVLVMISLSIKYEMPCCSHSKDRQGPKFKENHVTVTMRCYVMMS